MVIESNSSRIAVNTFLLYLRSLIVLLISLYTSRVVLRVLGVEDYGIYNVVGGVIAMLSFLNSSMSASFQRFFNYEMGKRNEEKITKLFQTSLSVQLLFSVGIVLVAETIGFWFLNTKLVIAPERMIAANWIYQASIISFVLTVYQAPFNAMVISYEKMNIFAFISILDAVLKLVVVFLLDCLDGDKLIVYAYLATSISVINISLYAIICKLKFSTCKIALCWNKNDMKSLLNFGGWGMVASLSYTLKSQGINIVLNLFFGTVVNAARGIAYQILSAVEQFTKSFTTSFRPQLTKSYAQGDFDYLFRLYFSASKLSFYMLWCLSLPIIMETPAILHLWLGNHVPDYTVVFTRLILLTALVGAFANPTSCIAYATGNIRKIISIVSVLNLLIVPVAYFVLWLGCSPDSAMIVSLIISVVVQICRLFVTKSLVHYSLKIYCQKVMMPTSLVFLTSFLVASIIKKALPESIVVSLLVCISSFLSVLILAYILGLNSEEKQFVVTKIKLIAKSKKRMS